MNMLWNWPRHGAGQARGALWLGWFAAALSAAVGAVVLCVAAGTAQAGVAVSLAALNDSGVLSGLTLVLAFLGAGLAAVAFRASSNSR